MSAALAIEGARCLTREEAAQELRISLYLLDQEREAGRLGYERRGRRRVVIPWSAILEYRARNAVPANNATTSPTSTSAERGGGDTSADAAASRSGRKTRSKPRGALLSASKNSDVRALLGLRPVSR